MRKTRDKSAERPAQKKISKSASATWYIVCRDCPKISNKKESATKEKNVPSFLLYF